MDRSSRNQIRNLLLVIGSGVLIAIVFSLFLLYQSILPHTYELKNVLISKEVALGLNFNDKNPKTNGQSRFIFDKITFEFVDLKSGEKKTSQISLDQYQLFYELIQNQKSLSEPDDLVKRSFIVGTPSTLKIYVKTESPMPFQYSEKVFQEVDFASQGGNFRVLLRSTNKEEPYAYFRLENIYQDVLNLFQSESP